MVLKLKVSYLYLLLQIIPQESPLSIISERALNRFI
jgi:hypothetical protein